MSLVIESIQYKRFDEDQVGCLCDKLCEVGSEEFPVLPSLKRDDVHRYWMHMLKQNNFIGFNAYIEDVLVGVVNGMASRHPYNTEIIIGTELTWWVAKEHRGSLIGADLFSMFESAMKEMGAISIIMTLSHKNDDLVRKLNAFYLRKGYRVLETHYIKDI